jgi:hypothetical protein
LPGEFFVGEFIVVINAGRRLIGIVHGGGVRPWNRAAAT